MFFNALIIGIYGRNIDELLVQKLAVSPLKTVLKREKMATEMYSGCDVTHNIPFNKHSLHTSPYE